MSTDPVFNSDPAPQDDQNALDALVGEGKKFRTPEDLAKGKLESDNYIEQLRAQIADRDAKLAGQATLDEMLAKLQEQRPNLNQPAADANQPAKPAIPEKSLADQVRELLAEKDQRTLVEGNIREVTSKLVEVYGDEDKANAFVKKRAQELGVPVEFLQEVAAKSPKAFFETVRPETAQAPNGPTHGNVNPQAFSHGAPGQAKANTYRWYQELRKSNPSQYERMATQMHDDALKNPDAFFERN